MLAYIANWQGRNPAIAVAAILAGKLYHVSNQTLFINIPLRPVPLGRAALAKDPADTPFRH